MSQALYRKYRSRTLDEILGQDHVTDILRRALKKGRIAHAYLLTGPRGTGKTSVARILAHEINDLPYTDETPHLDIIEIDAASNNGVDDIRGLREKANIAPVSARYKVYIIDEVHMLSKSAFNALLKTLEEPPKHVVFILATTDADKLPATIISRVQQYHFRPITEPIIAAHLISIAKLEGFVLDKKAAKLIAKQSRGGFRDSIGMLDQLSSLADGDTPLTESQVSKNLGMGDDELIDNLISAYDRQDVKNILNTIEELESQGVSPQVATSQLLMRLREKLVNNPSYSTIMSQLIEVINHPHPDIKLLTTLLSSVNPPSSPAAPSSTSANDSHVSDPSPRYAAAVAVSELNPTPQTKTAKTNKPAADDKPSAPQEKTETKQAATAESFKWESFIDQIKSLSAVLCGLLSQCDHTYENGILTIYAPKPFDKKRLDSVKNASIIAQAMQSSHGEGVQVTISSNSLPPSDERLAAVAAIMGGGEEVSLEEAV